MAKQTRSTLGWLERRREGKRLKRQRAGDSPQKLTERHTPGGDAVDLMLKLGGVQRASRFKQ